jgi:hypothetical protein
MKPSELFSGATIPNNFREAEIPLNNCPGCGRPFGPNRQIAGVGTYMHSKGRGAAVVPLCRRCCWIGQNGSAKKQEKLDSRINRVIHGLIAAEEGTRPI